MPGDENPAPDPPDQMVELTGPYCSEDVMIRIPREAIEDDVLLRGE